jgi:dTDP-D-glucose 4,6-dehydratase
LECVRTAGTQVQRFVHVSTDEVYGEAKKDQARMDEKSELNPTNPYSATKAAAEFLVRSYAHSYKIPIIITRGNNVYGPRQYPEKLIPKFINLLSRKQPCPLHGTGNNQRSFLHVDDVSNAFDIILHKGQNGSIYNIGSSFEYSNLEVAKMLIKAFGYKEENLYITHVKDRAFNDFR